MVDKVSRIKEEVWKHFKDFENIYLTTCEGAQPRVRPVTLVHLDERFWVLTGTDNAKVRQIRKNPKVEFCLPIQKKDRRGYVRAAGLAKITQDRALKSKVAKYCDFFRKYWNGLNDPNYTLLEILIHEIEYVRPEGITTQKFKL